MDYDYLTSIISGYSNLTSLSNLATSALGGTKKTDSDTDLLGTAKTVAEAMDALGGVQSVQQSMDALTKTAAFSDVLGTAMKVNGVDEDTANTLRNIASAETSNALESEARSDLIMQNYLYATLMKDTLQNSLTGSADFTSTLFSGLALGIGSGDDSSGGNSMLSSLTDSTLSAISNLSAYSQLLENGSGESILEAYV